MFRKAFNLIELIIALAILAILAALIIPKLLGMRQAALIRTAQDQTSAIQNALGSWMNSDTISSIISSYGSDSYISYSAFTSVCGYLDERFKQNLSTIRSGTTISYIYTPEMKQLNSATPTAQTAYLSTNSYSVPSSGAAFAYVRIYWPNDDAVRAQSNPIAVLFLP
jgi:prepilin-type N-terminal cleavage/methylation domain-containing protein